MRLVAIAIAFALGLAVPALAAADTGPVPGGRTIVAVNGLVCDFCARSIEAVLGERAEVAAVKVDLDANSVTVDFKDGSTIPDAEITALIVDSGYAVASIAHEARP